MVSAPARISVPRHRTRSAPQRTPKRSPVYRRASSAPARVSVSPRGRRARSASPGVRPWAGPRRTTPQRRPRSSGRLARSLTALLALSGAMRGNTPYVGTSGKALAVWPLGTSGPRYPSTKTYHYGPVAKFPVVEFKRLPNPSRKMFPGGHALSEMYEPRVVYPGFGRKVAPGFRGGYPVGTIAPNKVLELSAKGLKFPKSVMKQAVAGEPIRANVPYPKWAQLPLANDPWTTRAVTKAVFPALPGPPPRRRLMSLPASVYRGLERLETGARAKVAKVAAKGVAKVLTAPVKAYRRTRSAITGTIKNIKETHKELKKRARSIPN